jgi:succinyl-diaminopimelate desuccinylase
MLDVVKLAQELIRCPSITPHDAGALDIIRNTLEQMGFTCHRLLFENVHNLYARRGDSSPNFCFLGHTDVVPIGDSASWHHSPFEAVIKDDILYGRGAVDMKGAIAAFLGAVSRLTSLTGSISLLITGDEEGPALYGTRSVLEWLQARKEKIDFCLVGEPTSVHEIGDTLKIGRRGSLSGILTVWGVQGHVAYPENFDNPVPRLMNTLNKLYQTTFDRGSEYFPATYFEVVSIDVGNTAFNVVPAKAEARFNVRFNDQHSSASLMDFISALCQDVAGHHKLDFLVTGEAFLTSSLDFAKKIQKILKGLSAHLPQLSTTGGTSDARFIHTLCPSVELGLKNITAHQVDEHVSIEDLQKLTKLYQAILEAF